ncbi:hypothetical protein Tco_1159674 [Tanacetum coccineum]
MFYQKNVDYVALLWEDFMFQADNRDISPARKENMPYPRFTKVIINHFISKDKTICMRNQINLHTVRGDTLLGTLKFISKTKDYQKDGALIPEEMINQAIKDSKAYKTYLDIATRKDTPKKARKFKKIALPLQKLTTVLEEPAKKPKRAKKPKPAKQAKTAKKTALAKKSSTIGKGMDLLSDVALLEAAQLKKVLKKNKQDTHMLHASGSSDEVGSQPKVPDELKKKITCTNEGTDDDDNDDDDNDDDNDDENDDESDDDKEEKQDDEFVHTPDDYVHADDETNDESKKFNEEEYEELYGDVNISLKDVEPANKEKGNVEMTVGGQVNVNQEGAGNQVKDDAQVTQKTEGPIPSSFISFNYDVKCLNFDNTPPVDTEVVLMLDINVQHEVPCTSSLLTIPQLTPIPTPTTTEVITSTTVVSESKTLAAFHQSITNLEKDVKELKTIDHSATLLSTIKSEVPNSIKEYLGTSLDDALYKVLKKHDVDIIKEHFVPAEIVNRLRQQYVPEKKATRA